MSQWLTILIFAGYGLINVGIAKWNATIVANRIAQKDLRQLDHFTWFLFYVLLCLPQYWLINTWFVLAVLGLHANVFPYFYNHYRHLAPFNLSLTTKSTYDKALVAWGFKTAEAPMFMSLIISLVLLGFAIHDLN